MFRLKDNICRRIALSLLVVFAVLFSGNTFFVHQHVGLDGRSVAHSHPFVPGTSHGHSAQQVFAISELNTQMITDDTVSVPVVESSSELLAVIQTPCPTKDSVFSPHHSDGRAPPVV